MSQTGIRNISTEAITDPFLVALNERQLRSRLRESLRWVGIAKWSIEECPTQERANMLAYWEVQSGWVEAELDRRGLAKRRVM